MHARRWRLLPTRATCALLVLLSGCGRDTTVPDGDTRATIVVAGVEHTLIGAGGKVGTVRADSAYLEESLVTMRLLRPHLTLTPTPTRAGTYELAAEAGTLDVATGIVRLFRPSSVIGAPAALIGQDTVVYDPARDALEVGGGPTAEGRPRR